LGLMLDIASIAKISTNTEGQEQPERLFKEGSSEPIPLDPRWEVTQLVTRIRDEVHRFVITFHRETRSKTSMQSIIDNVVGIGPERRSRLLRHYGSVSAITRSAPEEIAKVGRMPLGLAQKLLRHLGGGGS
jgi:excinuclease ABC subunit C